MPSPSPSLLLNPAKIVMGINVGPFASTKNDWAGGVSLSVALGMGVGVGVGV